QYHHRPHQQQRRLEKLGLPEHSLPPSLVQLRHHPVPAGPVLLPASQGAGNQQRHPGGVNHKGPRGLDRRLHPRAPRLRPPQRHHRPPNLSWDGKPSRGVLRHLPVAVRRPLQSGLCLKRSREMRAQYLGNALALTTVMVLLAGKDGFTPKFQDALNRVGLADAWGTIKPYLSRLGGAVSAQASLLTFAVLEKVAQRFPQDSTWATGLTADRIESMVEVLHDKGVTNDEIQNDIRHVAQAASNSPAEDGAASVADAIS